MCCVAHTKSITEQCQWRRETIKFSQSICIADFHSHSNMSTLIVVSDENVFMSSLCINLDRVEWKKKKRWKFDVNSSALSRSMLAGDESNFPLIKIYFLYYWSEKTSQMCLMSPIPPDSRLKWKEIKIESLSTLSWWTWKIKTSTRNSWGD